MSGQNTPKSNYSSHVSQHVVTTTRSVKFVTEQLEAFMKYKAQMSELGLQGRKLIETRQAEIVSILSAFLKEFESAQFSRVQQFSKLEIETLRSQLSSLEIELRAAKDEGPRVEITLKAQLE
jgi:hypothetical protein